MRSCACSLTDNFRVFVDETRRVRYARGCGIELMTGVFSFTLDPDHMQ